MSETKAKVCVNRRQLPHSSQSERSEECDLVLLEKEVVAVVLAAHRWSDKWKNQRIIIYSDNTVTVASINKGSSPNHHIMKCLHSLFWLSSLFNFHLTAKHLPGVKNIAADSASRLTIPGHLQTLLIYTACTPLGFHVLKISCSSA